MGQAGWLIGARWVGVGGFGARGGVLDWDCGGERRRRGGRGGGCARCACGGVGTGGETRGGELGLVGWLVAWLGTCGTGRRPVIRLDGPGAHPID